MTAPTRAFGYDYDSTGTPIEIFVDDGRRDASHAAMRYIRDGGRVERVTIEYGRKVRLYERPAK